jgi:hypothetical protein
MLLSARRNPVDFGILIATSRNPGASQEHDVGPQCFMDEDLDAPRCGVHAAPLVRHQSLDYEETSRLGDFEFFVCPVSGKVVGDTAINSPNTAGAI